MSDICVILNKKISFTSVNSDLFVFESLGTKNLYNLDVPDLDHDATNTLLNNKLPTK